MKYLDNKEIQNLKQYFFNLENIEFEQLNGIGELSATEAAQEFNPKKITTKISVDFFTEIVKVFIVFPKKVTKKETDEETEVFKDDEADKTRLILEKEFKIAQDFETVLIDGRTHLIPKYFDAENVKKQDEKTWQMIFYYIFNQEISEKIKSFNAS